jgi:hypothetical protein
LDGKGWQLSENVWKSRRCGMVDSNDRHDLILFQGILIDHGQGMETRKGIALKTGKFL